MSETPQNSQDINKRLIENRLKQAQQDLSNNELSNNDKLKKAQSCFKEAMTYEGDYPERAERICKLLKKYSDEIAQQTNPDWASAHEALNLLERLNLADDQTQAWQRSLWKKQTIFYLEKEAFAESCKALANLITEDEPLTEPAKLKTEIAHITRSKILQQAEQDEWISLDQMIKNFQNEWPYKDEINEWLTTISKILDQTQTEISRLTESVEISTTELQQSQQMTKIVGAVFFVTAVIYIGILIFA